MGRRPMEACGTHRPPEVFSTDGPPEARGTHGSPEASGTHGKFFFGLGAKLRSCQRTWKMGVGVGRGLRIRF